LGRGGGKAKLAQPTVIIDRMVRLDLKPGSAGFAEEQVSLSVACAGRDQQVGGRCSGGHQHFLALEQPALALRAGLQL